MAAYKWGAFDFVNIGLLEAVLGVTRFCKPTRRVKIDVDQMYSCEALPRYQQFLRDIADAKDPSHPLWEFRTVVWTKAMKRLFTIVDRCLEHKVHP